MGGPFVMVTRLGRMSSHHEGVSPSTDLSTRSMAVLAESRQSPKRFRHVSRIIFTAGSFKKTELLLQLSLKIPDSTGLQVLRCRVSDRRQLRHPSSYHRRRSRRWTLDR